MLQIVTTETYSQHLRRERQIRDRTNPLESLNDNDIYQRFCFNSETIFWLTNQLEEDLNISRRNFALLPLQQILIALRYYATGTFHIVCSDTVQCSKTTARSAIWKVTNALIKRSNQFIKFPQGGAADNVKAMFFRVAKMSGVIGCIDGSHIRIQRPYENEHQYVNRKFYHSINIQAICAPNAEFINVVAAWPGSTYDSRILCESSICNEFENQQHDGVLLISFQN